MKSNELITVDPEILGGTPVFKGTRVPVKTLFEYLEGNYTLEEFLQCFPSGASRHSPHRRGLSSPQQHRKLLERPVSSKAASRAHIAAD